MAKKCYIGAASAELTNLIPAISGADGWVAANASETHTKYSASALYRVGTAGDGEVTFQTSGVFPLIAAHKYYVRMEVYQETAVGSFDVYWPIAEPSHLSAKPAVSGEWTVISGVRDKTGFSDGSYPLRIDLNNGNQAAEAWFDGIMLIDLTAAFGAGAEPDAAWCDAHIPYFTGSKTIGGPGSQGTARRVKKAYLGVESTARRVRRIYLGVTGAARCVFSGLEAPTYYGTLTALSVITASPASGSAGGYAVFAGGEGFNGYARDEVNAYSRSLVRVLPDPLTTERKGAACGAVGGKLLAAGGCGYDDDDENGGDFALSTVESYDASLTHGTAPSLSDIRGRPAAARAGGYLLFGGGWRYGYAAGATKKVDAYDASLTRTAAADLSVNHCRCAGASTGEHALFAGGSTSSSYSGASSKVEVYDSSLTLSTAPALVGKAWRLAGTSVGGYAVFAGGYGASSSSRVTNAVSAYDASLTRSVPEPLSAARGDLAATALEGYALFAGGRLSSGVTAAADGYDASLVHTVQTPLSTERALSGAACAGDAMIFAGGETPVTPLTDVDCYLR